MSRSLPSRPTEKSSNSQKTRLVKAESSVVGPRSLNRPGHCCKDEGDDPNERKRPPPTFLNDGRPAGERVEEDEVGGDGEREGV